VTASTPARLVMGHRFHGGSIQVLVHCSGDGAFYVPEKLSSKKSQ
jgi:hypothetical protein